MPVIRRGDADGVDGLVVKHAAHVGVWRDLDLVFVESLDVFAHHVAIHITKRREPHALVFEAFVAADVAGAATTETDHGHVDGVSRAFLSPGGFGDVENAGGGGDGLSEETTAVGHGAVNTGQVMPDVRKMW